MKKRLLFILCLSVFAASAAVAQQTRTVTNKDLEKFRQTRVAAERDLRENYARLGFPSPEESDRRNAESRRRLSELSRQLEAEQAERENADFLRQQYEAAARASSYAPYPNQSGAFYGSGYYGGGGYFPFGNYNFRPRRYGSNYFNQNPYRIGFGNAFSNQYGGGFGRRAPVVIQFAPHFRVGIGGGFGGRH